MKIKLENGLLDELRTKVSWDALDLCVVVDVLFNCEGVEDRIRLWAIADHFADFIEICADVILPNCDNSSCWINFIHESFERGRLAGAVHSEQCKAFSSVQSE